MTTKHDRDLERAVARFEDGQEKLLRKDGSKYYGDQEHAERLERLSAEFGQRVDGIIAEAEGEAEGYEEAALALSYQPITSGLDLAERSRLNEERHFVEEDCRHMSLTGLTERLRAVALGNDKAAKTLHARYARRRLEAEDARVDDLARRGANDARPEAEREAHRRLGGLLEDLEEDATDRGQRERRQAALEKAGKAREAAARAQRKRMEMDGADRRASEETVRRMHEVM